MEYINNNKKKLTIDNIISIIGHLLTIVSLFLVFLTLREMQIQRDNTYLPQIVAECKDDIILKWINHNDIMYLNSDSKNWSDTYLDIYNIGVGTAKNIEFEWCVSNSSLLAESINNNSNNIKIDLDNQFLSVKSPHREFGGMKFDNKADLNFLVSASDKSYKLKIPYAYLICYKIMFIEQIENTPPLELKISFMDIQGKKYEQFMHISPTINELISTSGIENEEYSGYARIKLTAY